jgi:nucleoid-associated protein YgaU
MPDKDPKNDFSDVVSGSSSTAPSPGSGKPDDWSDVVSGSSSTAPSAGGSSGGARTYVVVSGDSLSKIAKKFYGNANAWKRIFDANTDRIKNPDVIQPGWTLKIPE